MGLPALKDQQRQAARRPHLRVVRQPSKSAKKKQSNGAQRRMTAHRAAHQAFVFFAAVVMVAAVFGVGRVWLSVQAAEASIDCGKLRSAIKAARYEGDMLEIQKSALATPSRIQGIAIGQLKMAPATSVSYLQIDSSKSPVVTEVQQPVSQAERPAILDTLIGIAAAQARMLLVGDVGLSSSR
jgi:cell division protein FtsL